MLRSPGSGELQQFSWRVDDAKICKTFLCSLDFCSIISLTRTFSCLIIGHWMTLVTRTIYNPLKSTGQKLAKNAGFPASFPRKPTQYNPIISIILGQSHKKWILGGLWLYDLRRDGWGERQRTPPCGWPSGKKRLFFFVADPIRSMRAERN